MLTEPPVRLVSNSATPGGCPPDLAREVGDFLAASQAFDAGDRMYAIERMRIIAANASPLMAAEAAR